jgi:hypothetical protein
MLPPPKNLSDYHSPMSSKIQNLLHMTHGKIFESVVVVTDEMRLAPPNIPIEMNEVEGAPPSLPGNSSIYPFFDSDITME